MALFVNSVNCRLAHYLTCFGSLIVLLGMAFEVKPAAVKDPQSGNDLPVASLKPVIAWSIPLQGIVGLAAGDWDLRNQNDVIVATTNRVLTLDAENGKVKHQFARKDISHWNVTSMEMTELRKGQSGLFLCRDGWPNQVPVIGSDGSTFWSYRQRDGIDSAAWVDLRGTGDKVLLVGCNGFGGLHAVRSDGNLLWQNRSVGNVWRVSGIDARGGRPGLALCTGDDIEVFVFDAAGKKVGQLRYEGHWIRSFAAAELNTAGLRQVLALCSIHGKQQIDAVAMDLNGKILWKYPADWGGSLLAPIVAADVAGTGTKQWLLPGRSESLIVLDAAGRLVARIDRGQKLWRTWTAVARKNEPGWVVTSDLEKLVAYKLNLP